MLDRIIPFHKKMNHARESENQNCLNSFSSLITIKELIEKKEQIPASDIP